jgi:hypothetical protein
LSDHYLPLLSRAHQTIMLFAVGNSEHVLTYKGVDHWADSVEWARFTGLNEVDTRKLRYHHIRAIVLAFRAAADSLGIRLKVFDQVDGGAEFVREYFKLNTHTACFPPPFHSYDVGAQLRADSIRYASAPNGIVAGTLCRKHLVDQMGHYVRDLGFGGMMYATSWARAAAGSTTPVPVTPRPRRTPSAGWHKKSVGKHQTALLRPGAPRYIFNASLVHPGAQIAKGRRDCSHRPLSLYQPTASGSAASSMPR